MPQSKVRIYHNPRCTKSREALGLLRERGVEPEVFEYLKTPLSAAEVKQLIGKLGVPPHEILRAKEAPYAELGLSPSSTLDEVASAVERAPILLERPIVVVGKRAAVGRPPERVLALL
jgi:arsenate reductase (glutaredoxin)